MSKNLKFVWAEFSTLSLAIWVSRVWKVHTIHMVSSRVENSAQFSYSSLKFVHNLNGELRALRQTRMSLDRQTDELTDRQIGGWSGRHTERRIETI
jgi:hypothetical protein